MMKTVQIFLRLSLRVACLLTLIMELLWHRSVQKNLVFPMPLPCPFCSCSDLSGTLGGKHFYKIAVKELEERLQNLPGADADIICAA